MPMCMPHDARLLTLQELIAAGMRHPELKTPTVLKLCHTLSRAALNSVSKGC